VGIQVNRGVVTLTGTVENWGKVRAAEEAAHRARDVFDVANELVVRSAEPDARSDAEIARAVRQALEWDVTVPDARIRTTVTKGVVTLVGSVSEWRQRLDAERAIEGLRGVKRVANHIEVAPPEEMDAAVARRAVEKALERHVAHEASRIEVDAHEGIVKVSGVVSSPEERRAVLGALRGLRGVREIADDLAVESQA
jgi:osmotically-inducible protein OsmY